MKKLFLTGMRPTNRLTIGNYLGGINPLLSMQELGEEIHLFVATLHGITDNEPQEIRENVVSIVGDYIAAGVDPTKIIIYDQFDIRTEIMLITGYLNREITIARLLRLPTLKEKVRGNNIEHANIALFTYPTLMAADILCQKATHVPVGKDQKPHLELTREIIRSFNRKYGDVLLIPHDFDETGESINILSLVGEGKMSKSNPAGALFLSDSENEIQKKISKAETGSPGENSERIESMLSIVKAIEKPDTYHQLRKVYDQHLLGKSVMREFKNLFTDSIIRFNTDFQRKRNSLTDSEIRKTLSDGKVVAYQKAKTVRKEMEKAMGLK